MVQGLLGMAVALVALAATPALFSALYQCNKRIDFITPTYLFTAVYTVMILFGAAIDTLTTGGPVLLPAVLGFGGFVAGVYIITKISGFQPRRELFRYRRRSWCWRWNSDSGHTALLLGGIITALFTLLYFANYGVPILADSVENARLASTSGSDYYIYAITVPLPFFVTLAWLNGRRDQSSVSLRAAAVFAILAMAITTATGYRALVGHILILLILAEQFHTGRVNLKWLAGAVGLFAGLFVIVSALRFGGASGVSRAFMALWDRIVMVNVGNIAWIMSFIPSEHGFLLGRSYLMDLGALLPGPDDAFSGWLTGFRKPGLEDAPVGMTPTLIGESYANFGFAGVIVIPFIVGVAIQSSWIAILRHRKYIDVLALYLLAVLFMGKLALRGIGGLAVVRGLPILLMAVGLEVMHQYRPVERLRSYRREQTVR